MFKFPWLRLADYGDDRLRQPPSPADLACSASLNGTLQHRKIMADRSKYHFVVAVWSAKQP
jgi:hypothetical protein